jgi:hypothetical protein
MSQWTHILTRDELKARFELTASLDPRFARDERAFYEACDVNRLEVLAHGAWLANDRDAYQLARSYAALLDVA